MKAAVSKEVLFSLIDLMVSSSAHSGGGFRATGEAWLNPQPLPPLPAANAVHPEPWRAAAVARQIISMASLARAAAADETAGLKTARAMLAAFVDDFCGTGAPRRIPLPPPWPRSGVKPNHIDLLVAAAQFHAVGNGLKGEAIAATLAELSDRLLEVGLQRFEPSGAGAKG